MIKGILSLMLVMSGAFAYAESSMDMNYENADVLKVLNDYSKASGQKVIIDPSVRGKITLMNPQRVSLEEALNQLSTALAINGLAYTDEDGVMTIRQARSAQRANIPVTTELPPLRPERMVTWVVRLKNISADEVMKQVRTMSSKDGEMASMTDTNQLIFSDFTSSLHRIAKVIKELDQPVDAAQAKIIAKAKKERQARMKSQSETAK